MKLLAKSDIQKAKSLDRQREIDEGLRLAKKVDSLREITVNEEASLTKFRRETLASIAKEIFDITEKRDNLQGEVGNLENRKEQALIPLTRELGEIEAGTHHLIGLKASLDAREIIIRDIEAGLESKEVEIANLEKRTAYTHSVAMGELKEAGIIKDGAETMQRTVSAKLQIAGKKVDDLIEETERRRKEVTDNELAVIAKEGEVEKREVELEHNLIRLRDRESTLERNIIRLK